MLRAARRSGLQAADLGGTEGSPFAERQLSEVDRADLNSLQLEDFEAEAEEQAAHLAVASFGQFELHHAAGVVALQQSGATGP